METYFWKKTLWDDTHMTSTLRGYGVRQKWDVGGGGSECSGCPIFFFINPFQPGVLRGGGGHLGGRGRLLSKRQRYLLTFLASDSSWLNKSGGFLIFFSRLSFSESISISILINPDGNLTAEITKKHKPASLISKPKSKSPTNNNKHKIL